MLHHFRQHPLSRNGLLDDSDIECIINNKKELEFPTEAFAEFGEVVGMG